ncbi:pyridoxine 5'-phosphate synthase [Candidatus Photodesmus katoptron]|uniref:pyridoxine 5'-phosphate synthase n=1 Tax=Candidatus Photodesmus anomalopis TaxID=28176 RepID=UPI0004DA0240|nr:pyridoxine 5'-phosphate synthase [Candidatus Photodesmus katoptron]KEY90007.1 pyridoxine 5'-phosphate synthase [Candidatus Photodesmus katoptron]
MNSVYLGVNIDHIATLRNVRREKYPDPVHAAGVAEKAGADSITIHLREDRRHILENDLYLLRQTLQTRMNLEIAVSDEMLKIALNAKPESVCFVPEKREELTTEGGLDIKKNFIKIKKATEILTSSGITVSLFIDADREQINAAKECSVSFIELHTGHYANAQTKKEKEDALKKIAIGASYASELNISVNAGHGLTYHNVNQIAALPEIYELNIGHAIIARALFDGLQKAVSDMKTIIRASRESH